MNIVLEKDSTVSQKGQTTIPIEVRQVLGVEAGDRVTFRVDDERSVSIARADEEGEGDPVVGAFLSFLAEDIRTRPEAIRAVTPSLEARLRELTAGTHIDENDRIEGDVGL